MTTTELPRLFPTDRLVGTDIEIKATQAECDALAARLLLPGVAELYCRWHITALPEGIFAAKGLLKAVITQTCVVSLEPFLTRVEDRFEVRFVPESLLGEEDEHEEIDEIPYQGNEIDLGEATAEQLALSLDPFPRKEGAELHPSAVEDLSGPFAALATLKAKIPDPK
jgi:hypothetical protein